MSMTMNALQIKSFDTPDERRAPEKTVLGVNHFRPYTIGRMTMQPGWSWSECIQPVVHTDSCQLVHVGYAISGTLETVLDDGTTATITAGDAYPIPSGHNARVVGDEPFIGIEFECAGVFGVPTS
ncbi:cupin domain-containing protein [Cryobacterium levicorallinum]|uniref:Cupin domain-containing protein n=2 Tax=Cryobacterium levicorallinum TaxID=995038 RepID=A0ABY1EGK4_9MICO|nr:cupin domain-containing protein [Cryobacterium levicorallinum]GEP27859.1 hypothetical protein CLE01_24570 [Cryobacterium levicorallinum]SFH77189.1 hypothetical protein SAMN05216274_11485 [Cryobacterium levicorallinum]